MIPIAKNIKRYFSLKELTVVFLAVIISVSAGVGVFLYMKKDVVINDNGKQSKVKTMKSTVAEVLEQNGINVNPEDYISVPTNSKLHKMKENKIKIKRAVPVNVVVDGKQMELMTYRNTVKEALANSTVKLAGSDKLEGINLDDPIKKDMTIKIIRVKEEMLTEKLTVPYKVIKRANNQLTKGNERVVKKGQEGLREKVYKIVFEDGKEVARQLLKDSLVNNPISAIIEFGTVMSSKTSRGDTLRYSKVIDMKATAYTASYKDTGKKPSDPGFGITATGIRAKKGVVAVDPRVIPLGTRLYIEFAGNTPDYGYAVAADTAGAVKGNIIDLYYEPGQAQGFGWKKVKVFVLTD